MFVSLKSKQMLHFQAFRNYFFNFITMYYYNLFLRIIIALVMLLFVSCKKEDDITAPDIEFSGPQENQTFNVNDVMTVSGVISDDNEIKSVSIQLLNSAQQVVLPAVLPSLSSPSMNFSVHYPIDDIHLESGAYFIMITASDGKNERRKYRKIYLNEVPRVLRKIFVITQTTSSATNWSYIDSTLTSIYPYYTFNGDYIGSSVSDYYQQIFNCGNYTGDYISYDDKTKNVKYSIPGITSVVPYFTAQTSNLNNTYIARYDEFIKGYDYLGSPIYNTQSSPGYYVTKFIFNDGWMISQQQSKIPATKIIVSYYPSGLADVQTNISQDVVAMVEKDNTNVFMFGNNAGQATIQLYDRINNNLWNPYPFSLATGALLSAVKIDNDTYLIGHSNGTIYKYQYVSSGVTVYLSGYTAKSLKYDFDSNKLFVAENNKVSVIDYATKSVLASVNSSETILDIHPLYNR